MLTGIVVRLLGAWADVALAVLLLLVWAYGDITGRGSEKQKAEIARLSASLALAKEQQESVLAIQTKMAETMSSLRLEAEARKGQVSALIAQIESEPASGACLLDDARRMRLRAIRIGPPASNSRSR